MKFSRSKTEGWEWDLSAAEWSLLQSLFSLFPLVPSDHHRLPQPPNQTGPRVDPGLLEDSLESHRKELRRTLDRWLKPNQSPRPGRKGATLSLRPPDLEHLLQVLNDIRVGSWIRLGCPNPDQFAELHLSQSNRRWLMAMEFSGLVQAQILRATEDPHGPPDD